MRALLVIACVSLLARSVQGQDAWSLLSAAAAEHSAENTSAAVSLLKESLRLDSTIVDTYVLLGQVYLETDSLGPSQRILLKALDRTKKDARVYFLLGSVFFRQERYRQAAQHLSAGLGIEENPQARSGLSMCYHNLGVSAYDRGDTQVALRHFESAVRADHSNIQSHRNLAVLLLQKEQLDRAAVAIETGLRADRRDKALLVMLVQLRQQTRDFEGALDAAEQLYRYHADDIEAGLQLAYLYRLNNRGDESIEIYEDLIRRWPTDRRGYEDYADLFVARGHYDKAIDLFQDRLNAVPEDVSVYVDIARIQLLTEEYDEARSSYRQALQGRDEDLEVFHLIAKTHLKEGHLEPACGTYLEALEQFPTDRSLQRALGLVSEKIHPARAIPVYRKMSQQVRDDPYPHVRLGVAYSELDSVTQALVHFFEAINLGSSDPVPYHRVANAHLVKGDSAAAAGYDRKAIVHGLKLVQRLREKALASLVSTGGAITLEQLEDAGSTADSVRAAEAVLRAALDQLMANVETADFEDDLDTFLEVSPDAGVLLEYKGRLYEHEGRADQAVGAYVRLLKVEPDNRHGHLALARIWERTGRRDDALMAYERALTTDDQNPELYKTLIEYYESEERLDELADEWLVDARRAPDNRVLLEQLVVVLTRLGRTEDLDWVSRLVERLN